MKNTDKIAVALLNLGGPEKLDDVRPFLFNLFSDRRIIRLGPAFLQKPIAWWISKTRAPKSQGYYQQIGGGSPLNRITTEQGEDLASQLASHGNFSVCMAMRYWHPFAEEVLPGLRQQGIKKIVALTLYPHYSIATTGSSIIDLQEKVERLTPEMEILEIDRWPEQASYVNCLVRRIRDGLAEAGEGTEVVYSAHSLPVKFIEEGDPYLDHLKKTIAAIEQKTGAKGHLCFQSRSGPVTWLEPSTPDVIEKLAAQGAKGLLMVPLSFVSDHVETLCEIDIQYREKIEGLGMEFRRIPSLNRDPEFIKGLKDLVVEACEEKGWLS